MVETGENSFSWSPRFRDEGWMVVTAAAEEGGFWFVLSKSEGGATPAAGDTREG